MAFALEHRRATIQRLLEDSIKSSTIKKQRRQRHPQAFLTQFKNVRGIKKYWKVFYYYLQFIRLINKTN